jgi:CheY-like chemotaxis protein
MVFGFMKQSGGHINVYSEPGVGTTFRLYLPRDEHAERHDDRTAAETSVPSGGGTVLVAEDNPALRRLVVLQLTTLGYRVQESENAVAALALLEAQTPDGVQRIDLLLADVVMPGKLDGYDLARTVLERWPSTKIVLMSGFPGTHLDRSPEINIPLLSKPYRRDDLARILRVVMDGQP